MIDKDQQLLWEAYMSEKSEKKADKDYDGDGEVESSEDEYKGSVDKKIKQSVSGEAHDTEEDEENEDKEVQEEGEMGVANAASEGMGLSNPEFSAIGRENPEQQVFDAVLSWMRADTEGLTTPEDYEGYSMSDAFDDAKEFIRDVLQDISFTEIKSQLTGTMSLHDSEEASFEASVDDDIRRDDSRLQDMPPREPGV
jgi:hypothetical protein